MAETKQDEQAAQASPGYQPRYIDIGINLADPVFRGRYHGKRAHPDDLSAVLSRAHTVGCTKLIVTGSSFRSSRDALRLAAQYPGVYTTAGIHPCSSAIFSAKSSITDKDSETSEVDVDTTGLEHEDPDGVEVDQHAGRQRTEKIIGDLRRLVEEAREQQKGKLVAFGEFGLDYDRLHFCPKALQLHSFESQLQLAMDLDPQLPLFLHSRAAHADFVSCMKGAFGEKLERLQRGGVVHSFTGTADEMNELMDLGLYIGINGCSFKTPENCEVVKQVRLDRLMLETDGPWCDVRPSHEGWKYLVEHNKRLVEASKPGDGTANQNGNGVASSPAQKQSKKGQFQKPEVPERFRSVKKEKWVEGAMVKGRNEPCMMERVAMVVACIKGVTMEEVCEAAWANTVKVFHLD